MMVMYRNRQLAVKVGLGWVDYQDTLVLIKDIEFNVAMNIVIVETSNA